MIGGGIAAATSGAIGIADSVKAAKAQKEAKEEAQKERERQDKIIAEQKAEVARKEAEDKSLFERQYYQDITKRSDIQNMLRVLDQNQKNADTRDEARATIAGATPEQKLAAKEVNRRTYADALADMGSNAAQMRDSYIRDYRASGDNILNRRLGISSQDLQLGNPMIGINQNTAAQASSAANNAFAQMGNSLSSAMNLGLLYADAKGATPFVSTPKPAMSVDTPTGYVYSDGRNTLYEVKD